MPRAVLAVLACLLLNACSGWVSDERLFGDGDWAHLDINGRYKNDNDESDERGILKTLPNGLIEGRSSNKRDKDVSLTGLIPIRGGSGEYFLMVDRSDPEINGDTYFIAHVTDDKKIEFFMPDCRGTSDLQGMTKERDEATAATVEGKAQADQAEGNGYVVCKFHTKDALMAAGLEAERFLATKHIIAITPFVSFLPDDEARQPAEKRVTRRPPPRRSRR
jgi:hypothetical protein